MISLTLLILGILQLSSGAIPKYQTCTKLWKKLGCRADLHHNLTLLFDDRSKNMVDWDKYQDYELDFLCRCRQAAVASGHTWFAADKGLCLSKLGNLGSYLREFPLHDQAQCSREMTQAPVSVPDGSRCIDGRFQPFFYTILTFIPPTPIGSSPPGEAPPEEENEEKIVSAPEQEQQEEVISSCQTVADVFIVVDTSGSIGQNGITQTRNFIKSFMDRFDFTDGTRIGIISYSDDCDTVLTWEQSAQMSKAQLKNYCDTITGTGGSTLTDVALNCTYYSMKDSNRPNVPMTVVVMTDGMTWGGKTMVEDIAQKVRDLGAKVVSVGIGLSIDPEELNAIAGTADNRFLLADYSEVTGPQFLNNLIAKSCRQD